VRERNEYVETQLLAELQRSVLQPHAMEYALSKFELELENQLATAAGSIDSRQKRSGELDIELARLAEAIATQGPTAALLSAISVRESERRSIDQTLWESGPGSIKAVIAHARGLATEKLGQIRDVIQSQTQAAPVELAKHVDKIVMRPTLEGDQTYYVAEGDWNLLGKYEGRPGGALRNSEMVAGVRFELTTFGLWVMSSTITL
jgi:hypothetical protein